MKQIITLLTALAAFAAHAAEPLVFDIPEEGLVVTSMPETLRSYMNKSGYRQHDMLWLFSTDQRPMRIGLTGCDEGEGEFAFIYDSGRAVGEVDDWTVGGKRHLDEMARHTCALVHDQ